MRKSLRLVVGALVLTAAGALAVPAATAGDGGAHRRCAQQFDAAARQDMATFGAFDLAGWRAVHRADAITVFVGGRVETSFEATAAALARHFTDRNAVWTYTELHRRVLGCDSAYILYDTTYAIPSIGFSQRATVGVSWTYERGRWLVVADQNTLAG